MCHTFMTCLCNIILHFYLSLKIKKREKRNSKDKIKKKQNWVKLSSLLPILIMRPRKMSLTYRRVLSTIKKVLKKLVEEYFRVSKSL